jgi:ATP-dependent helicase HrpA
LYDALDGVEAVHLNESNAEYEAVHRSILSGLLGHVSQREERNVYKASGNRMLTVFPGSAMYDRGDRNAGKQRGKAKEEAPANTPGGKPVAAKQPEWIVAGEIVETSQLFARTVAGIDPEWIVQLAPHLCKITHLHPHWTPLSSLPLQRYGEKECKSKGELEEQRQELVLSSWSEVTAFVGVLHERETAQHT